MTLTQTESVEIKKQILEQLEKTEIENKADIKEYISNLNEEQLEEFIKNNKIGLEKQNEKPIFQLIVENEMPSYKIAENKESIAVLEINPLSKGHCIILPKENTGKIPKECFSLIKKITKKIKTELNPKDIKIENFALQNYPAVNIVPIYDKPLKRDRASEDELKELQIKLQLETEKEATIKTEKPKKITEKLKEISFRIP